MTASAADGVADELGRVFDQSKAGTEPFYRGLYIADASIIPMALGVNPSLTISALALRVADKIIEEIDARDQTGGRQFAAETELRGAAVE